MTAIFGPDTLLGPEPAMLVGGRRVTSQDTRPVDNPATGEVLAQVPEAGAEHVEEALRAAAAAQRAWARRSHPQRGEVLAAIIREIDAHAEELARIVVAEQGKTITEARGELAGAKAFLDVALGNKYRDVGELVAPNAAGEQIAIREEPYGVVVAIIPWNYPAAIFARKVGPALMAGNAVVVKASEVTPLSPLAMARVCQLAGVPDGLVSVLCGAGPVVGRQLVGHPLTAMVTVTGSTRAGREILATAADRIVPVSLELGGKAPVIVLPDADLDLAVPKAVEARFWNCGQVCTCNERTYVHRSLHDEFVARFVERASAIRVGDPTRDDTEMGPKVSAPEWDKVKAMVDAAVAAGATVALGGGRPDGPGSERGYFFAPTVLTDVTNDMEIVQREVFGPVLPVIPFDSYEQAIGWSNATQYGLTAYVFTESVRTAMRAVDELEFGEVYINEVGPEQFQAFHSGWKLSGLGGDDGRHGYERYVRRKTVYLRYGDPQP
jgi:lactaldehyde dehydrogenase/glycolaldehyde dehydrogenase